MVTHRQHYVPVVAQRLSKLLQSSELIAAEVTDAVHVLALDPTRVQDENADRTASGLVTAT